MNDFYVYAYIRLDTNTYFYVGKGHRNRYLRLDNRSEHFKNIINKTSCVVEILYDNLSEEDAFLKEMQVIEDLVFLEGYSIEIKGFSKNRDGYHLVNRTWGGEGTSGLSIKQTQETIQKRVDKNTGKKRNNVQRQHLRDGWIKRANDPQQKERLRSLRKGALLSEEARRKISDSHKGKSMSKDVIERRKKTWDNKSDDEIFFINLKRAWAVGIHVKCIELDLIFVSISSAITYIKSTYNILFNKNSLKKHLNGNLEYYGEVIINDKLIKLHWEYYN